MKCSKISVLSWLYDNWFDIDTNHLWFQFDWMIKQGQWPPTCVAIQGRKSRLCLVCAQRIGTGVNIARMELPQRVHTLRYVAPVQRSRNGPSFKICKQEQDGPWKFLLRTKGEMLTDLTSTSDFSEQTSLFQRISIVLSRQCIIRVLYEMLLANNGCPRVFLSS